jgi:hypothetical protein
MAGWLRSGQACIPPFAQFSDGLVTPCNFQQVIQIYEKAMTFPNTGKWRTPGLLIEAILSLTLTIADFGGIS